MLSAGGLPSRRPEGVAIRVFGKAARHQQLNYVWREFSGLRGHSNVTNYLDPDDLFHPVYRNP